MQSAIETESSEFERQENDNFGLKVADAVWVGAALLTRDRDAQAQFSNEEIVASVLKHRLTGAAEKSIRQHVVQHCVAEYKPQPNRSRMLHATSSTHRRLFHDWEDIYHPAREGTPTHPAWENLPKQYADLQQWYEDWKRKKSAKSTLDPLLGLIGTGRGLWDGRSADDYVDSLREGWESFV